MNPLKSVVTRKASEVEPHKLREQLQHLGPIFVKAGHYLALRPDILSDEYCYELLQLPDTAPARPWEEIESVLRDELGDRLDTAFQSIDHRPHSSGVLSQRHCARTADGADVVIKVLAPGTRERVERDLRRGRALARALDASGISLGIAPRQLADEISAWLTQQLDYRRELENLERWERLASASDIDAAPRPLPDLCSERVLTTEFMGGTPMLELLLASTASDGEERWRRLAEQGIDRDAVSENLIASTLRQIFRDHFFNGQMHPGNLIVLPGNVIGFIDFGLCQELDPQFHEPSIRVLAAIYRSDTDQLYRSISEILVPGERANISAFRAEFIRATRDRPGTGAPDGSSGRDASIGAKPLALAMSGVMRAARHHDLTLPVGILPMIRSLLAASTIADRLCVDADLLGVGRRFFTRLEAREAL
ncbi:MAG TPA: AarF/UbiB family protein, partial [Candidatus Sulfotelmatobacter sp.]|nr:AarF/UbiB family protein [Candidatus Sulfotelmatobacter sp.]